MSQENTPERVKTFPEGGGIPLPERLPPPTVWPATLGFGATLLCFGILTSWVLSMVGLGLFLLGIGGWVEDLRNDQLQ